MNAICETDDGLGAGRAVLPAASAAIVAEPRVPTIRGRNPVDIELLMRQLGRFAEHDNDNDNDNDHWVRCPTCA
jgi:hypothetical protein